MTYSNAFFVSGKDIWLRRFRQHISTNDGFLKAVFGEQSKIILSPVTPDYQKTDDKDIFGIFLVSDTMLDKPLMNISKAFPELVFAVLYFDVSNPTYTDGADGVKDIILNAFSLSAGVVTHHVVPKDKNILELQYAALPVPTLKLDLKLKL